MRMVEITNIQLIRIFGYRITIKGCWVTNSKELSGVQNKDNIVRVTFFLIQYQHTWC